MKNTLVVGLLIVIIAAVGITYLFVFSPTPAGPSTSGISSSSSTSPSQQTTTASLVLGGSAHVTANFVTCTSQSKECTITLLNTGNGAADATGCTLNGQTGVFGPGPTLIPPGGSASVSCAPAAGGAVPVPGFHVEGLIQLSDGSSVQYLGNWN